jgi:hypothetical protein
MKAILALLVCLVMGCVTNNDPGPADPNDPNDPMDPNDPNDPMDPNDPNDPQDPTLPVESCLGGNNCVCPGAAACGHTCSAGAPECHVQGSTGQVDVVCNNNLECHVECSDAVSCAVDCGGSADCNVTCPGNSCEVTNCDGNCTVSCGNAGEATKNGTTATCP